MIILKSHGFKFSRPEANIVFDVSYLKNPWRDENIRNESSAFDRKQLIMEHIRRQAGVLELASSISNVLEMYDLLFPGENIVVAMCCSAGEYRSPAMVEIISHLLPKHVKHEIEHSKNSKL